MENIYTSHFKPAIKIPYQQKRESKIHEFSTPKFRGADALKNNEDVIESINVENNKGNHFNDWDFEEADDITIGNTSILKTNLPICASKNKNFSSNNSFQLLDNEKENTKEIEEENKIRSNNEPNLKIKKNGPSSNENEEFITEIEKDYETILSKDIDLEETLNNMNVISISSTDNNNNVPDIDEIPSTNKKISNNFNFDHASKKEDNESPEKLSNNNNCNISPAKSPRTKKKAVQASLILNHPFRTLIFSPYASENIFMKHLLQTYKGLVYAKKCLKGQISDYQREKAVNLKEKKGNRYKTLFLDLDETLIHACSISENPQHIIKGTGPYGSEILIGFNIRPYCIEFLRKISQFYEIVIFTASMSNYAHAIINFLDPYHQYINEILTRSSCIRTKNGFFIKDLRIIKNRELKNMMLVDNLSHSFGFQIDNGIPILEFLYDRKDRELKYLYDHLLEGLYVDDVRAFNRKKLQLNSLSEMRIEDLRILN